MKEQLKETREWLTMIISLLCLPMIGWLIWSVNQKMELQKLSIESTAAKTYVAQDGYEKDRAENSRRLDGISADLSTIKIDMATMKERTAHNNKP